MAKKKDRTTSFAPGSLLFRAVTELVLVNVLVNPDFLNPTIIGENKSAAIIAVLERLHRHYDFVIADEVPPYYKSDSRGMIELAYADSNEYRGKSIFVKKIAPPIVEALKNLGIILRERN